MFDLAPDRDDLHARINQRFGMMLEAGALAEGSAGRRCTSRVEQVHAAEGYARSTGKVGVVLVTSGPGATNAVTGLTDALMDSIPWSASPGRCRPI